ncbi:TMV resistance protein N-like [Trifolium medium]|uniref:TMV resistance protein N-like n=1 Tax=Trifolium medium TaxID=97028 RepID=A0A392MC45_9FABA|nr:TMV resistance protein N-like [Trifolium medium]
MLWDQVKKERHGLEIVMPGHKLPKWFDYRCKEGIPCLWVCGKFPNVTLALSFRNVFGEEKNYSKDVVQLQLVINGQSIVCKCNYNFRIGPDHVLVCDLRLLYNDEEWLGIDALLLKQEWNQVQISYEVKDNPLIASQPSLGVTLSLSEWGVFVFKQGIVNLKEHVQFTRPGPTRYSNIANMIEY